MTDGELVVKALSDKSFFRDIVLRYEDKLSSYIRRLGVYTKEDRQDVLQDIFIKVYVNLNGFDTTLTFSSWIYRIAHNEAISWYRKHAVRPEGHLVDDADGVFELVSSKEDTAEKLFDMHVNAQEVRTALASLDLKYRDALVLRFFEHKEYDEIGDILKIPTGTVGTLIHRGKESLKKKIDATHIHI